MLAEQTTINGASGWYALSTRHQHEKAIAETLSKKNFEVFLPVYTSVRSWKDRKKQLSLPLFPCYVFIVGGLERRLEILTTPGVWSFVSTGGRPSLIPCSEIDAIRRALEGSFRLEPHPHLQCGDRVRIRSGALEGIEGILIRRKGTCHLVLSVGLLGRSAAVEVDIATVERVGLAGDPSRPNAGSDHSIGGGLR